ncbi:hypothetical protein F4823DRAFT_329142 [Ustulina deusta]|nr:hypothetical protein F4823DRAFT_329142 [Ustulina deusta]
MHMDSIYQYAALTIIAAAGTDETYGLLGVSRRRSRRQWSFEGDDWSITSTLPPPQCSIRESRWATRGWTYQEAVLSPRRLFFTDDQLYFECNSMGSYESLHVCWDAYYSRSRPYLKDFMKPTLFPFQPTPSPESGNFATYTRCAEQYSRRTLSFDSDSLNAFSGIIRKLETAETSPVYHIWGIPFTRLAEKTVRKDEIPSGPPPNSSSLIHLLHVRAPMPDPEQARRVGSLMVGLSWHHSISTVPPRRRADFPSWSWAGWEGAAMWPTTSQDCPIQSLTWPGTLIYFEECSEDAPETCDTTAGSNQLRHPRTLCIEAAAMSRNAFILGDNPQKLCISSGGGVTLYPSKRGLDAVGAFEGIQGGRYEVIRLATVGANSYMMLVEVDGQMAYRVGTLVVREFYLTPRLFISNVKAYRII